MGLLRTTGGKDEPNIVFMRHLNMELRTQRHMIGQNVGHYYAQTCTKYTRHEPSYKQMEQNIVFMWIS